MLDGVWLWLWLRLTGEHKDRWGDCTVLKLPEHCPLDRLL